MSEVRDNLLFLAKAVREAEVAELRQRSPIRSLPFGSSNASYPKQVIDVVENSAKRDYAFVHEWNQHFEEPLVLPADTIPKFQWWKAGLRFPFLLAWPTYDPLKRYHLTAQGRDLWLAEKEQPGGLRQHLWSTFGSRASFNYGASTLRNIYFGMAIASASFGVVKATTFLLSSDRRIAQEEATSLLKKITEPETSKKILQKYHERPGGSPAVNNFFDQENVKLREHIRQHGDPDGTLTEEILENEELRDALKN